MAKVTITFRDDPDGKTNVAAKFTPDFETGEKPTRAQEMAMRVMRALGGAEVSPVMEAMGLDDGDANGQA